MMSIPNPGHIAPAFFMPFFVDFFTQRQQLPCGDHVLLELTLFYVLGETKCPLNGCSFFPLLSVPDI